MKANNDPCGVVQTWGGRVGGAEMWLWWNHQERKSKSCRSREEKKKKPLTEDSTWITRVSGMKEHCLWGISCRGPRITERNLCNKDISKRTHFLHGQSLVLSSLYSKNHNCWSDLKLIHGSEMEDDVIGNILTEHLPCIGYCDTLKI